MLSTYSADALSLDETDGVSLVFTDWRFNLRRSNTEPLVRLNIEARGASESLKWRVYQSCLAVKSLKCTDNGVLWEV